MWIHATIQRAFNLFMKIVTRRIKSCFHWNKSHPRARNIAFLVRFRLVISLWFPFKFSWYNLYRATILSTNYTKISTFGQRYFPVPLIQDRTNLIFPFLCHCRTGFSIISIIRKRISNAVSITYSLSSKGFAASVSYIFKQHGRTRER